MKDEEIKKVEDIAKLMNEKNYIPPFDGGISEFKRQMKALSLPKTEYNKVVKDYKNRVYSQVNEIKERISERAKSK